ncbi:MAG: xdhA [Ilumatobacteraceae bacterium]|nr:xdhA [Ilumatobacteraceae bacterium]
MSAHLKMDEPVGPGALDDVTNGLIGRAIDRPDGPLKVSGAATYAYEWDVADCLYGVLVRSTIAQGKLVDIDRDQVLAMPGVIAVVSDPRFLRNSAQGTANKAPVQGPENIAYVGQPIALVVAGTFEQARHGAKALKLSYAAADDACFDPEAEGSTTERPDDAQHDQGDLDQAMRSAAFTVDSTYRTPGHSSAPMEPHSSIASWDGDQLTLRGSYQMLKYNRNELADSLGIAPDNVRILAPFVGGGFGSKLGIAAEAVAAAIAAQQLGRPVCVAMSRQQVFESTMRRSETRQRVRLAADADGVLTGIGHECLVSNLPDEVFFEPVVQATHFLYGGQNRRLSIEVARVNRTCAGSVRAPGEAVGMQALENAMDEMAATAGIDPVELRKRNIPDRHPEKGTPFSSHTYAQALDEGARRFGWDRRKPTPAQVRDGEWLIGMGMAGAARVNRLAESKALVTLLGDGTASVETDMTDIGTGTYAILTQIAGEMLGLPVDRVTTRLGDTRFPPGSGSGGSFGASSAGSAVFLACQDLRRQLAELLECDVADLDLTERGVRVGERLMPLSEALRGNTITAEGHIEPGAAADAVQQASYGAHFAEVAVSAVTGETRVRRMLGVFGAGRILNEKTATSQCYGGMVWGIGMALTEQLAFDPRDGHIVNRDFAEYHVPVNLDVPQIEVVLLDDRDPWASPIGAKGLGELGICGAAAAITNAIHNATGIRVYDYPATLDKLLAGLPES